MRCDLCSCFLTRFLYFKAQEFFKHKITLLSIIILLFINQKGSIVVDSIMSNMSHCSLSHPYFFSHLKVYPSSLYRITVPPDSRCCVPSLPRQVLLWSSFSISLGTPMVSFLKRSVSFLVYVFRTPFSHKPLTPCRFLRLYCPHFIRSLSTLPLSQSLCRPRSSMSWDSR